MTMVDRRGQSGDGPRPMRGGIDRLMRHLKAPQINVVESIFADWSGLVGEVIGGHSRPVDVADGVLVIEVDDPAWASELGWLSESLIERIGTRLETNEINEIRVRIRR
jgi:predicted nucleic acid-binding Zn ribbon protein